MEETSSAIYSKAGKGAYKSMGKVSTDQWERCLQINGKGAYTSMGQLWLRTLSVKKKLYISALLGQQCQLI